MTQICNSMGSLIKLESDANGDAMWSEEHDCLPLKQRLKLLLASKGLSALTKDFDLDCSSVGEKNGSSSQEQIINGRLEVEKCTSLNAMSAPEIINAIESGSNCSSLPLNVPVKIEHIDFHEESLVGNCVNGSSLTDLQAVAKIKNEISDDCLDDLDHVVLKDRLNILLLRKESISATEVLQDKPSCLGGRVRDMIQQISEIRQGEIQSHDNWDPLAAKYDDRIGKTMAVDSADKSFVLLSCTTKNPMLTQCYQEGIASNLRNTISMRNNDEISSEKISSQYESSGKEELSGDAKTMLNSAITASVNPKAEPLDSCELDQMHKDSAGGFGVLNMLQVKPEYEAADVSSMDRLDHMLLRERMKFLSSRELPLEFCGKSECSRKLVPSALDSLPTNSEPVKPLKVNRPRKRRKTATDSVGTALEEDAPGLLQVLMEKGISVDEMRLYGQTDMDEALDDSSMEDSFSELEAVIMKLFSQRNSFLKFPPLRCNKGEKASYCLACLFSLVEQARYLRFRNWPVEWGWCRDLQSFIFVFERHNRIVLERPEYGYATYFFELIDSLPIDWQIKRLVTAMKLTSCSRVTLIENRALSIGEDLSEGEARVLMDYGWMPNSGLATMLNYCDRVVHDRKNEKDNSSEWRSKIGKLLADGYNGGTIVSADIPRKLSESKVNEKPQVKLEPS